MVRRDFDNIDVCDSDHAIDGLGDNDTRVEVFHSERLNLRPLAELRKSIFSVLHEKSLLSGCETDGEPVPC